jgi:hypothetical protein
MDENKYLNCNEISIILNVDRQVIQKWAREEKIPCLRVGVGKRITYRFNKKEILEFFKNNKSLSTKL